MHVVGELDQIINARPLLNDRIFQAAPVNGGIRPNLHMVSNQNTAQLRLRDVGIPLTAQKETESPLTDPRPGLNFDEAPDARMAQAHVTADPTAFSDLHVLAKDSVSLDHTSRLHNHMGLQDSAWTHKASLPYSCRVMDHSCGVNLGGWTFFFEERP
jgi:hypothetical protein